MFTIDLDQLAGKIKFAELRIEGWNHTESHTTENYKCHVLKSDELMATSLKWFISLDISVLQPEVWNMV